MSEYTPADVTAWLGPAADEATPEQAAAILAGWRSYAQSITDRDGEPGDWVERDTEVTSAIAMHVLGDDLELETLGASWRATRELLYARAVGAVHAGMPEAEAARRAGIDRMTVRKLLGKQ